MDGPAFDRLARSWARPRSRRGVLGALAGLAAGLVGAGAAGAACAGPNRPCGAAGCCGGATCQGGVCRCPAGSQACGGACVLSCPPDQVMGAGCRCLCKSTGLVPGSDVCPTPTSCVNPPSCTVGADPSECCPGYSCAAFTLVQIGQCVPKSQLP